MPEMMTATTSNRNDETVTAPKFTLPEVEDLARAIYPAMESLRAPCHDMRPHEIGEYLARRELEGRQDR